MPTPMTPAQVQVPESSLLDRIPALEPDLSAQSFLIENPWSIEVIVFSILLLFLLIACFIYWFATRKKAIVLPPSPEQIAYRELDAVQESLVTEQSIACISLKLSLILREYLTGETNDPALFETHQEFSQRMGALAKVPANKQLETRMLLERLAENKYTNDQDRKTADCEKLAFRVRDLIASISYERLELQKKALANPSPLTQKA